MRVTKRSEAFEDLAMVRLLLFVFVSKCRRDCFHEGGELGISSACCACGIWGSKQAYPGNSCQMTLDMRDELVNFLFHLCLQDHLPARVTFKEDITAEVSACEIRKLYATNNSRVNITKDVVQFRLSIPAIAARLGLE